MDTREQSMKYGINGNCHPEHSIDPARALHDMGVAYLGDGEWMLPDGATIEGCGGDDWILSLADGTEYHVWSEDE